MMQCYELEQILEQQAGGALPEAAVAHVDLCESCRGLLADLEAIRLAALDLGAEDVAPPERLWISLRNQLEAEGLIRQPRAVLQPAARHWWSVFQRPALAGAWLALLVIAAGLAGYRSGLMKVAGRRGPATSLQSSLVPPAPKVFNEELSSVTGEAVPGLPSRDPAIVASFRRNLNVVNDQIDLLEKSLREQPENEVAREYLYGAYEQKAELLATATDRGTAGGLW